MTTAKSKPDPIQGEQSLYDPTWLDRIKRLPAIVREHRRLSILIGGTLAVVLLIGAFASWRYVIWRLETKELRHDAFLAYEAKDFEKSAALLTKYIGRRPEDTSALNRLALARLEASEVTRNDLLEASTALQHILEIDPSDHTSRRSLTDVYVKLGFLEEAEAEATALLNAYPRDTFAFQVLTGIKLQKREYQESITLADSVLAGTVIPDQLRDAAMLVKSRAYLRLGEMEDALFWAEELVKVSAANLQAQELYLQLVQRLNRPADEFARHARRLYEQRPDVAMNRLMYAAALQAAARRAASSGDREVAEGYIKQTLDLLRETAKQDLTSVELRLVLQQFQELRASTDVLALLEEQLGRDDASWVAREFARRAVLSDRQEKLIAFTDQLDANTLNASAELLGLRTIALAQLDRRDEAKQTAQRLTTLDSPAAKVWLWLLNDLGLDLEVPTASSEERLEALDIALADDRTNPFFQKQRAQILEQQGSTIAARTALAEAIRWAPYWSEPAVTLAQSYLRAGDSALALRWAGEAVRRNPKDASAQIAWAEAATRNAGRLPEAQLRTLVEGLAKQAEQTPAVLILVARGWLAIGEIDKADAVVQKVITSETLPAPLILEAASVAVQAQLPSAASALDRLTAGDVDLPVAQLELMHLLRTANAQTALDRLEQRRQAASTPTDPNWRLLRAQSLELIDPVAALDVYGALSSEFAQDRAVQLQVLGREFVWADRPLLEAAIDRLAKVSNDDDDYSQLLQARFALQYSTASTDWQEALQTLVTLARNNPEHLPTEARMLLAQAANVFNLAEIELVQRDALRGQQPTNPEHLIALIRRLDQLQQGKQAKRLLQTIVADDTAPDRQRTRALAVYLADSGRTDEAVRLLERHYAALDIATPADRLLGGLYVNLGRTRRAEAVGNQLLLENTPDSVIQAADLFTLTQSPRRVDEARRRAEESEWDEATRVLALARLDELAGEREAATNRLVAASLEKPENPALVIEAVGQLLSQGQATQAIELAAQAKTPDSRLQAISSNAELIGRAVQEPRTREILGALLGSNNELDVEANIQTIRLLLAVSESSPESRPQAINALIRQVDSRPRRLIAQLTLLSCLQEAGQFDLLSDRALALMLMFPDSSAPAALAAPALARAGRLDNARNIAAAWRNRLTDAWPADQLLIALAAAGPPDQLEDRLELFTRRLAGNENADLRVVNAVAAEYLKARQVSQAVALFQSLSLPAHRWANTWPRLSAILAEDAGKLRQWIDALPPVAESLGEQVIEFLQAQAWYSAAKAGGGDAAIAMAAKMSEAVVQRPGASYEALSFGGLVLFETNRLPLAATTFERVLLTRPNDLGAINNLSMVFVAQNQRLEEARELAERALAMAPDNPAIMDTMARVLAAQGRADEALVHLNRAVQRQPKVADWRLFRVKLLKDAGRPTEALQALMQIKRDFQPTDLTPTESQTFTALERSLAGR